MAFTEFCCRSGGSNLNAGTLIGDTTEPGVVASITYASGTWVQSTRVFTVASGDPVADGVAVGDYVSVYADGSTVTGYVSKVTARDTTTITMSSSVLAGTAPTDGTSTRTLKVGGSWKGPNAAESFPFGFVKKSLNSSTADVVRVNLKNDADYSVTATVSHTNAQATVFQGYSLAYGDYGQCRINGGGVTTGTLLSANAIGVVLIDIILYNNSTVGHNSGVAAYAMVRCVCDTIDGGFTGTFAIECIGRNCGGSGGIAAIGVSHAVRCIAYGNAGPGFSLASGSAVDCIAWNNTGNGFVALNSGGDCRLIRCDAYDNGGNGFAFAKTNQSHVNVIEACNAVKNGSYGVYLAGATNGSLLFARSCRMGSGTEANTTGDYGAAANASIIQENCSAYADDVTPWTAPDSGDFSIALAAAKSVGVAMPDDATLATMISYIDVGAVQAAATGGGGVILNRGMSGGFNG